VDTALLLRVMDLTVMAELLWIQHYFCVMELTVMTELLWTQHYFLCVMEPSYCGHR
jgi:hypothetical protein